MDVSHFTYPIISGWTFGYFHSLAVINNAAMKFMYVHKLLGEHMFSFLLGIYLEVKLLDHMATLLNPWKTARLFPKMAAPFYTSPQHCMRAPVSPCPQQHLLFSLFLVLAILQGVTWYLIMVWICVSVVTNYVQHFFSCTYWPFEYL